MTALVPADAIEQIVGAKRHPDRHIVNAVTSEQTAYILHPDTCRATYADLRNCPYSHSLDEHGIPTAWWDKRQAWDRPVFVALRIDGPLWPCRDLPEETP